MYRIIRGDKWRSYQTKHYNLVGKENFVKILFTAKQNCTTARTENFVNGFNFLGEEAALSVVISTNKVIYWFLLHKFPRLRKTII